MALPRAYRPRSTDERLRMTQLLAQAPRVVALNGPDDGWVASCLRVSGRVPVWANDSDPTACEEVLRSFGLSGLGHAQPEASIGADGVLRSQAPAGSGRLAPVEGPLITIVICTYNRARMLRESIASAQAQNWPHEIVVVNDGSTDETERVLDAIDGIEVIHKPNGGKPSALNAALKRVRGEAVLVLDDDDLLLPGALNVLGHALFSNPELVAVFGDSILFSDKRDQFGYRPGLRYTGEVMRTAVLQQIPCATGATLIRTSAHRQAGEYDARLRRGEDMDMFLRLAQIGPMESVPLPTFLHRDHEGLRGSEEERWGRKENLSRYLHYAKPVFRERWMAIRDRATRQESHGWVLGLNERGLHAEAREEALRWSGPHSAAEQWVRQRVGLPSIPAEPRDALVVVDDGDEGALEDCLQRHSEGRRIHVALEVPRDPLGNLQIHWPGNYVAQRVLSMEWVEYDEAVHLRVSSDPEWAPPPLRDFSLLPEAPAPEAVRAYAHAIGWPEPRPIRRGLPTPSTPLLGELRACRAHLESGNLLRSIAALKEVLRLQPDWLGAWWLAAEVFERAGMSERAREFRERVRSLQVVRRAA